GGGNSGNDEKAAWYQGGLQVGFGHFAVGFSGAYYKNYAHAGYAATTSGKDDDGYVVTVGGSYTIDAWSFGLQGMYGHYNQGFVSVNNQLGLPGGDVTSVDAEKFFAASLNGAYALGPGISLEAQIAWTQANYGNASLIGAPFSLPVASIVGVNADTVHSWELDIGTAINF